MNTKANFLENDVLRNYGLTTINRVQRMPKFQSVFQSPTILLPLPKPEQSLKGEATDFIAFAFARIFLLPFSAQKSRVKFQNHLNHYRPTTSAWHFSFIQSAILDI
jgi:hypothetical protein